MANFKPLPSQPSQYGKLVKPGQSARPLNALVRPLDTARVKSVLDRGRAAAQQGQIGGFFAPHFGATARQNEPNLPNAEDIWQTFEHTTLSPVRTKSAPTESGSPVAPLSRPATTKGSKPKISQLQSVPDFKLHNVPYGSITYAYPHPHDGPVDRNAHKLWEATGLSKHNGGKDVVYDVSNVAKSPVHGEIIYRWVSRGLARGDRNSPLVIAFRSARANPGSSISNVAATTILPIDGSQGAGLGRTNVK